MCCDCSYVVCLQILMLGFLSHHLLYFVKSSLTGFARFSFPSYVYLLVEVHVLLAVFNYSELCIINFHHEVA
jgi:hypothetical protein